MPVGPSLYVSSRLAACGCSVLSVSVKPSRKAPRKANQKKLNGHSHPLPLTALHKIISNHNPNSHKSNKQRSKRIHLGIKP
jgi:hypothetical protein